MASAHSVASRDTRLLDLEDRCGYLSRRRDAVLAILENFHYHDQAGRHSHELNDPACEVAQLVADTLEELQGLARQLDKSVHELRTEKAVA